MALLFCVYPSMLSENWRVDECWLCNLPKHTNLRKLRNLFLLHVLQKPRYLFVALYSEECDSGSNHIRLSSTKAMRN